MDPGLEWERTSRAAVKTATNFGKLVIDQCISLYGGSLIRLVSLNRNDFGLKAACHRIHDVGILLKNVGFDFKDDRKFLEIGYSKVRSRGSQVAAVIRG
ncbi:hypothetical protein RB195_004840 [Necator americanus]|uniref:Uncharacterized protein n=1 Tax=Necator americanus TaxID=51031 RepID=A0ABR1BNT7_NECAM